MPDYRILGRDSTVRVAQDGELKLEITAVSNMSMKLVHTVLSEGFLGEPAKRHREIFDEVQVSFAVEPEGRQAFLLQQAVYNRARAGQANPTQINVSFRYQFPSGVVVRITVPDVKFDAIGDLDNSGREAFVKMTFSGKSDKYILV